jgi:DNA-binding transcriptional LysR family regulator
MRNIELSQLEALLMVGTVHSFSKAAKSLGVTQSAISQNIKNLENKLKVSLLYRGKKSVTLTQEGEKLYQFAKKYLNQLDDTLNEINLLSNKMHGKIKIGTLRSVGKNFIYSKVLDFLSENPGIDMEIVFNFPSNLVREFEFYNLDMLIIPEDFVPAKSTKVFLGNEYCNFVYPKDKKKRAYLKNTKVSKDNLEDIPFIQYESDDSLLKKWAVAKFGKDRPKVNIRLNVNSHSNILQAVVKGLGSAIIPLHVLEMSPLKAKLEWNKNNQFVSDKFYLVYHPETGETEKFKDIINQLTRLFKFSENSF